VDIHDIENRLWDSADELRANSGLKESEYSVPMLGLIFLKYADNRFGAAAEELGATGTGRRQIGKADYQARGVMFLPEKSRFGHLLNLPEGSNLGQAVNDAMKAIEDENEELRGGVLPRTYNALTNATLATLIRNVNSILGDIDGDGFGKVYEYFLGKFAMAEGRRRRSCGSSWRSSSPSREGFSILPAVRVACSCRARASWRSIGHPLAIGSPFMGRSEWTRRSSCAG